jgi:hypothetical protein
MRHWRPAAIPAVPGERGTVRDHEPAGLVNASRLDGVSGPVPSKRTMSPAPRFRSTSPKGVGIPGLVTPAGAAARMKGCSGGPLIWIENEGFQVATFIGSTIGHGGPSTPPSVMDAEAELGCCPHDGSTSRQARTNVVKRFMVDSSSVVRFQFTLPVRPALPLGPGLPPGAAPPAPPAPGEPMLNVLVPVNAGKLLGLL